VNRRYGIWIEYLYRSVVQILSVVQELSRSQDFYIHRSLTFDLWTCDLLDVTSCLPANDY